MTKVLFSQRHYERRREYSLETKIIDKQGTIEIIKTPLFPEAEAHINNIIDNHALIKKGFASFQLPKIRKDSEKLIIEHIDGKTLESDIEYLLIHGKYDQIVKEIEDFIQFINSIDTKKVNPYLSEEFVKTFDPEKKHYSDKSVDCWMPGIFDINFDNFIKKENKYCFIDFEWCFDFPVPRDYMLLRAILYLSIKLRSYLATMASPTLPCYNIYQDTLIPVSWLEKVNHSYEDFQQIVDYDNQIIGMRYLTSSPTVGPIREDYSERIVTFPLNKDISDIQSSIDLVNKYRILHGTSDPVAKAALLTQEVNSLRSKLQEKEEYIEDKNIHISNLDELVLQKTEHVEILQKENKELNIFKTRNNTLSHQFLNKIEALPLANNRYIRTFLRKTFTLFNLITHKIAEIFTRSTQ